MKFILITIIFSVSLNLYAQFKLNINPNDASHAKMQLDCADTNDCDAKLVEWISRQKTYQGEWNDISSGSIVSKSTTELVDEVEQTVTKYYHSNDFAIVKTDITSQLQEKALELAIEKKVACGDSTVKYIAKRNVQKGLTTAQIRLVAQTYSQIFDLLKGGAIDTAKEDIQAASPDGTIITEVDKTAIIAFINGCQ